MLSAGLAHPGPRAVVSGLDLTPRAMESHCGVSAGKRRDLLLLGCCVETGLGVRAGVWGWDAKVKAEGALRWPLLPLGE